jgi:thioredoxin 1
MLFLSNGEIMSAFVEINESSFNQEVIQSAVPVLVEFGAVWCGPCRQIEPVLEQLAAMWAGKVRLAKVDVDQSIAITQQYQVMSVPTLILFVNGEACERLSGKPPRDRLIEKFSPHL